MYDMNRRALLQASLAATLAAGCHRAPPKQAVLASLVEKIVTADVRALVGHSDRLAKAIGDLNAAPTSDNVSETRQRWHDAVVVWTRASCFRNGPLVETSTLLRALHWPVQKNGVEGLVLGGRPIDDALIEKAPVDQKGLYAIELLVFPSVSADRARVELLAPEGARARLLAAALAVNVSRCAGAVHQALGDGRSYAESFARNGQESVSLLVNQMVENVENASGRLLRLSPFQNAKERGRIEEGPRETSRDLVVALIEGTERLYVGHEGEGLGALEKGPPPLSTRGSARHLRKRDASSKSSTWVPLLLVSHCALPSAHRRGRSRASR